MTAVAPIPAFTAARTVRLGVRRVRFEVKQYVRAGDQLFFTFFFPTLLYALFATIFSGMDLPDGVTMADAYLPGMIAGGVLLSGLQNLATDIAVEKYDGTLKRLGGSPLSPVSYFIGKFGQVFVTGLLQTGLLLAVASFAFGARLPSTAGAWLTAAWVYVLGLLTCSLLGIALSSVPRSGKSAGAVVVPIVLVLQFISGVYLQFSLLPGWLQTVAGVFPVRWMAQGMRAAFLPPEWAAQESGGSWALPLCALLLAVWAGLGFALARFTFRWVRRDG